MEAKEKLLPRQESIEAKSGCLLASCDFTKEVAPLLGLKEGDRVLDIGSGIGGMAFHLAKVCRRKCMPMFRLLDRLGSFTVLTFWESIFLPLWLKLVAKELLRRM